VRWLAVWLLLTAVYLAALALSRPLTGRSLFTSADLVDTLLIPAAQVAALAALAATASLRRKR
jgi:nucleoside recognition membrane protein YjiH